MDYYSNAYGMNQYLTSFGYVGYGMEFREVLNMAPPARVSSTM